MSGQDCDKVHVLLAPRYQPIREAPRQAGQGLYSLPTPYSVFSLTSPGTLRNITSYFSKTRAKRSDWLDPRDARRSAIHLRLEYEMCT